MTKRRLCEVFSVGLVLALLLSQASAQMTTPGNFFVANSGAARYSIPIVVPKVFGDLKPNLSLEYSSQGGNGRLGVGWTLSGLSDITRCPANKAQEGRFGKVLFDSNDRFCIDGEKLIAVSGVYGADKTEYRTERDGFSKITSFGTVAANGKNGPEYFVVKTKAGLTYTYGGASNSALKDYFGNTVLQWPVTKIADPVGNYLTVTYGGNFGSYNLSSIEYAANAVAGTAAPYRVDFGYEDRSDYIYAFQAGGPTHVRGRLSRIFVRYPACTSDTQDCLELTETRLSYETSSATNRSRLTSVQVCDGYSQTQSKCLPATKFTWTGRTMNALTPVTVSSGLTLPSAADKVVPGDFNGDGRSDVALFDSPNAKLYTYLSQGLSGTNVSMTGVSSSLASLGYSGATPYTVVVSDINGDGRADIVEIGPSGYYVLKSNGDGTFASSGVKAYPTGFSWGVSSCYLSQAADLNNDGFSDLLIACQTSNSSQVVLALMNDGSGQFTPKSAVALPTGSALLLTDWDQDGYVDLIPAFDAYNTGSNYYRSNRDGTFAATASPASWCQGSATGAPQYEDFNGDGIPDCTGALGVIFNMGDLARMKQQIYQYPTPTATAPAGWVSGIYPLPDAFPRLLNPTVDLYGVDHMFMDVNGDDIPDIIFFTATDPSKSRTVGQYAVAIGRGDGYFIQPVVNNFASQTGLPASPAKVFTDIDGDGRQDFIVYVAAGKAYSPDPSSPNSVTLQTGALYGYLPTGEYPDLITKIEPGVGLGNMISITYKPLSSMGSAYEKNMTPPKPQVAVTPNWYVVSQTDMANGLGGYQTNTYRYGGAVSEPTTGRGILGFFQWIQTKNESTGLVSRTYFRQDFPFYGQADMVGRGTSDLNWSNLGLTKNKYTFKAFGPTDTDYASPATCVDDPATGRPLKSCIDSAIKPGNRYVVYPHEAVDKYWDWNDQSNVFIALPQTRTTTIQDNWGNATQTTVETLLPDGSASGYSRTTSTVFSDPDKVNWRIGRAIKSTVTNTAP